MQLCMVAKHQLFQLGFELSAVKDLVVEANREATSDLHLWPPPLANQDAELMIMAAWTDAHSQWEGLLQHLHSPILVS